jgi:hypothetical protein
MRYDLENGLGGDHRFDKGDPNSSSDVILVRRNKLQGHLVNERPHADIFLGFYLLESRRCILCEI